MITRTHRPERRPARPREAEPVASDASEPASGGPPAGPRLHVALATAIAIASAAAFSPALDAGFVSWDDGLTITENFAFRGLDAERLRWMATTSHAGHYQPLSWLSLALDHRRLGLTPPAFPEAGGFHATNLALHALTALVLYALGVRVFALALGRGGGPLTRDAALAVAFATLLHAVHPLRCESVCWVTERRDVLSAPFFLLSLLAYLRAVAPGPPRAPDARWLAAGAAASVAALAGAALSVSLAEPQRLALRPGGAAGLAFAGGLAFLAAGCAARGTRAPGAARRGGWLALSLGCLLASLLAKAWGIVLPAVLLVLDVWPLRRLSRGSWPALLVEKLPFLSLSLGFAALARWAQVAQQGRLDAWALHDLGDRAVQALYGIAFYPARTLWPVGLSPLYPIPDELSLAEPRFGLGALCALAVTGLLLWRRRAWPWALAAWVAYLAIVSPVLGVQQSGPQLVADRYAYLAGIPLAWLGGGALLLALRRAAHRRLRLALLAAACAVLALLFGLSLRQSRIWHDSETLWRVAYASAPESPLAALNLGLALADRARAAGDPGERRRGLDRALALVREAVSRRPGMPLYAMNEAILLAARALPPDAEPDLPELERAIERGAAAIAAAEAESLVDASWYWHQGRMLAVAGRPDEAAAHFERALALRPRWPAARRGLAASLLDAAREGAAADPEGALERTERALALLAAPGPPAGELRAEALGLRSRLIARLRRDAGPEGRAD